MRPYCSLVVLFLLVVPFPAIGGPSPSEGDGPVERSPIGLYAVHPGGSIQWEHVVLMNGGPTDVELSGWSLGDGEGEWTLPVGTSIPALGHLDVCINATAFEVLWGRPPGALALRSGSFGLADKGDGLELRDSQGDIMDQLSYGTANGPSPDGWIGDPVEVPAKVPWGRLLLRNPSEDTDTAADWTDWAEPRCGWSLSREDPGSIRCDASTFVTPDDGWTVLMGMLASAEDTISIALYELYSLDLSAMLAHKAGEGVAVTLLIESAPVGATPEEVATRDGILMALALSGVDVRATFDNEVGARSRPYRFHHEKYCIVDGTMVLVTTENWVRSSFPSPEADWPYGSRGWGAIAWGPSIASDLESTMLHDVRLSSVPFTALDVPPTQLPPLPVKVPGRPSMVPSNVTLLAGPEDWGYRLGNLLDILEDAEREVLLELASLEVWWGKQLSPLVEALLDAERRGVTIRVLLDQGFDGSGRETMEELHRVAAAAGATGLRCVLASDLPGAGRVHAKGALIDGERALLGSMNWGRSSITKNREVNVLIGSRDAVAPLLHSFEDDWKASVRGAVPTMPRHMIEQLLGDRIPGELPDLTHSLPQVEGTSSGSSPVLVRSEPVWAPLGRAAVVLGLGLGAWLLERRFGLGTRIYAMFESAALRLEMCVETLSRWARRTKMARKGRDTEVGDLDGPMLVVVSPRRPPKGPPR